MKLKNTEKILSITREKTFRNITREDKTELLGRTSKRVETEISTKKLVHFSRMGMSQLLHENNSSYSKPWCIVTKMDMRFYESVSIVKAVKVSCYTIIQSFFRKVKEYHLQK